MHELQGNKRTPLSVFISYAHEDEPLRRKLETHLSLLRRQGLIADWHDRQILPGAEWGKEIDEHLEAAQLILLLISPDFLASDYCYDVEMQRALERQEAGEAQVIPLLVRPVDWKDAPFARLQCLPRDARPITSWSSQDEAFADVAQGLRRVLDRLNRSPRLPTSFSPTVLKNRARMLKRVRSIWTDGVLEHSLHHAALIALDLQELPGALANPWRLEVQETDLPPRLLPPGTSLAQVYDEAEGEVLILGEPGAGKTTLLLDLARTLIHRAEQDEHHPLPAIFPLSSWANKRQPLATWLIKECQIKYGVPKQVSQSWIMSGHLLPLLDGVDEIATDARSACVEAINEYHQEYADVPLIVCSRKSEYLAQPTRLRLQKAVMVQPLTQQQVETYFQAAHGELEGLRQMLQHDTALQELAMTPLMLSVLTLAYQGTTQDELPTEKTLEAQRRQIFATYVNRMLKRRGTLRVGTEKQIEQWLGWLGVQMVQHNQTEFYLERLQPDWLVKQRTRKRYLISIVLVFALLFGLPIVPLGMLNALLLHHTLTGGLIRVLLLIGLPGMIFGSLFGAQLYGLEHPVDIKLTREIPRRLQSIIHSQHLWILLLSVFWPFVRPLNGLSRFILLVAKYHTGYRDRTEKELALDYSHPYIWYYVGTGIGGIFLGLLVGLLIGLLIGLLVWLSDGFSAGLFMGISCLTFGAVFFGLISGLGVVLQNFTLHFWLWRTHCLPRRLISFLDESADRLLLYKSGRGYLFVHRLLLDYFASLEKKES